MRMVVIILALALVSCGEANQGALPNDTLGHDGQASADITALDKEPASDSANDHVNSSTDGTENQSEIISCMPGCNLRNDDSGRPIVPDWCDVWAPAFPVCSRDGSDHFCSGFQGDGTIRPTISTSGTEFHLQEKTGENPTIPNSNARFRCIQINRVRLQRFFEKERAPSSEIDTSQAMGCFPGCIVNTQINSHPNEVRASPKWCSPSWYASPMCIQGWCGVKWPWGLCQSIKLYDENGNRAKVE